MKQGWEIKKLGEVCQVSAGQGAPQGEDKYGTIGKPFIKAGNLEGLLSGVDESEIQHVNEAVAKQSRLKLYPRGSVLFAKSGMSCMKGHVYALKTDCYVVSHLAVLTPTGISTQFLTYLLNYYRPNTLVKDSSYPSISLEDIKVFTVPVPPIAEQEKIVAELDCLSGIIEKKKQQLKELDNLAQSIFYEMFGNPLENEKEWKVCKLGDISIKIANGYNAKLEKDTYKPNGIPYFRCQNIWWNYIDYTDIVYIDEMTNDKMKTSSLMTGDLIISKIGRVNTENSSLGRTAIYEGENRKANISGNLCYVRLNNSVVPKFVLRILTLERYRRWAMQTTPGGIDKRAMSVSQISNFPIITPPIGLQQTFVSKIESIEKQKELIAHSIKETETLFNSRMDYYFN